MVSLRFYDSTPGKCHTVAISGHKSNYCNEYRNTNCQPWWISCFKKHIQNHYECSAIMTNTRLHNLLSKRVIFVTGKGGVGKTVVSAALGIVASNIEKKTLLVELDTEGNIPKFFEEKTAFNKPQKLGQNLSAITIQPKAALHEYIILKLKFETLYKILFENRIVKFFINAVPGLNEILMIGKIWHLYSQKNRKGEPLYDLIIVDAPATGHSISFLQVPQTVKQIVKLGPIHEDANK